MYAAVIGRCRPTSPGDRKTYKRQKTVDSPQSDVVIAFRLNTRELRSSRRAVEASAMMEWSKEADVGVAEEGYFDFRSLPESARGQSLSFMSSSPT